MAKVTVPVSSIQEGDLISKTGLNDFIDSVNNLDGNQSGINGENVQNEGIEKRNLANIPDSINHSPKTTVFYSDSGQTIDRGESFQFLKTLPTFVDTEKTDMLLLVVSFDFALFADGNNATRLGQSKGGLTAAFTLRLENVTSGDSHLYSAATRTFTVSLAAGRASYTTTINGTDYRVKDRYHAVSNCNTATLFLGGPLDELMPGLSTGDTVGASLLGKCHRHLVKTSSQIKGELFNCTSVARLIRA